MKSERCWPRRLVSLVRLGAPGGARPKTPTSSSSWAYREPGRAVSRRSTSPAATSASIATSAAGHFVSSRARSTRNCHQALGASSSTTRTSRAPRAATSSTSHAGMGPTRCVWLDTPLAQAQVNLVERLLERFGSLPSPEELRAVARREPGVHAPTSQMRTVRELEPPSADEGFAGVEQVPFTRSAGPDEQASSSRQQCSESPTGKALSSRATVARLTSFRLEARRRSGGARRLASLLAAEVSGPVESALCPHPAGPPTCWCRPPLPGLPSPSRGSTASTRRDRSSSEPRPHTGRSRRPSARVTSRSESAALRSQSRAMRSARSA